MIIEIVMAMPAAPTPLTIRPAINPVIAALIELFGQ